MGILKVTFFTKIEKTEKCETLTHGDFDNIFEKNWKMIIFRWFSISQICGFEQLFHWNRSFDNIFDKNREIKIGYMK